MTRAGVLTAIVVGGLAIAGVAAQQPPAGQGTGGQGRGRGGSLIPPTGKIEHIKANLYKIPGAGSNTTVFVTAEGVVLVDTKLANNGQAILDQVKTVTDKPVSLIINTHSHPDHMGSNDFFPAKVEKVTHVNAQKRLAANTQYASNPAVMPTRTYTDRMSIGRGKDRIDLYYFGAGHTDNDAFVVFRDLRMMCVGDLMAWKMAPLIDPMAGGSVIALPDTLEKALKGIHDVDFVIEGHGDVTTWQTFRDYAAFNRALLDASKAGLGKQTPEQVAASLKQKFPLFTHEDLLAGMEYGSTALARAIINVNVAYQELRGEPVTTNFGPPRGGGAGRGGREGAPGAGAPQK